jgi:hypothetical protein
MLRELSESAEAAGIEEVVTRVAGLDERQVQTVPSVWT